MPPFPRRFSDTLFRASLYLLVIVIPFTTMAIPVITQELSRTSTSATATATTTAPSKLTDKEIFDIVFALVLFMLVFGCFALVGGFPFPPFAVIDLLDATFRPIRNALPVFRLRDLFRSAADDVVDLGRAPAAPQTHVDDTAPAPVPTSSRRPPAQNVELDALPTAPRCASSASNDSGLTSPSSA